MAKKKEKKLTNKQIEEKTKEFILKNLKDKLNHQKNVYETYIKVLVEYDIETIAYSAIKSDELYEKELEERMSYCTGKPEEFNKLIFGDKNLTEEQRIQIDIDYYDKLIKYIEWTIKRMTYDKKIQIAKDAVEKGFGWLKLSGENSKLENEKKKI